MNRYEIITSINLFLSCCIAIIFLSFLLNYEDKYVHVCVLNDSPINFQAVLSCAVQPGLGIQVIAIFTKITAHK